MKKSVIISGVLAALTIGVGVGLYTMRDTNGPQTDGVQSIASSNNQALIDSIPKSNIEKILDGYSGDEFDRFFIANMITHHQGAIDMAKLAQVNAQHSEIKQLAGNIITTQTKEKEDMLDWQLDWGFPSSSSETMTDHSAMSMSGENDAMTSELKSLSGEAYDKKFIELMIMHHESAVAMTRPGAKNAGHQKVKDITKEIINAQISEISQMKQWQKAWGY